MRFPRAFLLSAALLAATSAAAEHATDFRFEDINPASPTHGQTVALSDAWAEQGVVLSFLASWCDWCWKELPHLQQMADSGEARVIGIAADEYGAPPDLVLSMLQRSKLTIPVLWVGAEDAKVLERSYTYERLPSTYVIGSEGTILDVIEGALPPERLRAEIARAFGKEISAPSP